MQKTMPSWPISVILLSLLWPVGATGQDLNIQGKNAIGNRDDALLIATLLRSNVIGLHQAIVSGNFSVIRDLAAPSFREHNSAARLERSFSLIKDAGINLEAIAVLEPSLEKAVIDDRNLLWLVGTLRTKPKSVKFQIAFQLINRSWALFGLMITPLEPLSDQQDQPAGLPIPMERPDQSEWITE